MRGNYFEYLLTRFSEPNEVFGPIDLVRLREGTVATVTTRMLPEGEFVFLDELFNANSAILNNLLTVLNERVYRRGAEVHQLPLLSLFAASNHLPEDEALRALFDRFLLRCHVDNLKRDRHAATAGGRLGAGASRPARVVGLGGRPPRLARQVYRVELTADRRAVCRGRLQGARPGRGSLGPSGGQGAEAGGGFGAALRPHRGARVRLLGVPLRVGPRGADRSPGRAGGRRDRAACRRGRRSPPGRRSRTASTARRSPGSSTSIASELRDRSLRTGGRWRGCREQLGSLSDSTAWLADDAARRHLADKIGELSRQLG